MDAMPQRSHTPEEIFERFLDATPWLRLDETKPLWIDGLTGRELPVPVLFVQSQDTVFQMLILTGNDAFTRVRELRSGEWIPEYGLDFATTEGIQVEIEEGKASTYSSLRPGCPKRELKQHERELLFLALDAVTDLVGRMDRDEVQMLSHDAEEFGYRIWAVAKHWKAEVALLPESKWVLSAPFLQFEARLARLSAVPLPAQGVWEAGAFYLPVTRMHGDEEQFVQCAAVFEREGALLGLVTLEPFAEATEEVAEALLGAIEKQGRKPEGLLVRSDVQLERLIPLCQRLQIPLRMRKRLVELEHFREEMIDDFPEDA